MAKLRVHNLSISFDGYAAGPEQSRETPLGVGGEALHGWAFAQRYFRRVHDLEGGEEGIDNQWAAREQGIGATIMGRNMFGPVRGAWPDGEWKGWWGEAPPYHCPVFVLTHHPRDPLEMKGGTVFHFVTGGVHEALERAREAAGEKDIRIGGGAATIRQYLAEGLIDELHLVVAPVLLGRGEPLLEGLDLPSLGYVVSEHVAAKSATHVVLARA